VKIIGVAPDPKTPIQGLKNYNVQYVPRIWDPQTVDEVHYVSLSQGEETAQLLALAEGIFVGPSSGAIFHVAQQTAREIRSGVMVIVAPDGGEKYLSTNLCEPSKCLECAKRYGIKCSYFDGRPIVEVKASEPAPASP
jgi:cysteine synthase